MHTLSIDGVITLMSAAIAIGVFVGQTNALRITIDNLTHTVEKLSTLLHDHETRIAILEARQDNFESYGRHNVL